MEGLGVGASAILVMRNREEFCETRCHSGEGATLMDSAQELFFGLMAGALLGAFGQGFRVVAGIKKQWDDADAKASDTAGKKAAFSEAFDSTRFWLSIFIGAIAGVVAFLAMKFGISATKLMTGEGLFAVMAAGYAGADFVEGVFKKHLPSGK